MNGTIELWSAIFSWAFLDAIGVVVSIIVLMAMPPAIIISIVLYTQRQ